MAGPGGVPSGHPVAVEVPVVLLQLLEAVKGHKAVLALLLNAQEVIPPEMLCQIISSFEMGVCAVAHAQLAGEVAVMHVLPQLLPTEEVDIAETTEGMGRRQMGLQLLLTGKKRQLHGERPPCLQTDSAHVLVMLCRHMLGQGGIGGEGAVALGVTHTASPGCYMLQPAVQIAGMGYTWHWGIVHKDAAAPFGVVPQLA